MAKRGLIISISVLITLIALPLCYSHPHDLKVYANDDYHEVEEMEELEEVESTIQNHAVPAPDLSEASPASEREAVAVIQPENKLRMGKYTLHKNPRTWAQATEYCRNDNQHLVRIETSLELRTVLAHFTEGITCVTQVWTDGIGDLEGKKYLWATTGDIVDITELETRRDDEDVFPKALLLERKGLVGEIQTTRLPFICES